MRLGPKDVYLFDYRGIQKSRPAAFSRFRLWSQLLLYILDSENQHCGGDAQFYSLVADHNRVSNAFHTRHLKIELAGQLRTRVIFGHHLPIINATTHPIFIKNLPKQGENTPAPSRQRSAQNIESTKKI
jgi:hypothetical protein